MGKVITHMHCKCKKTAQVSREMVRLVPLVRVTTGRKKEVKCGCFIRVTSRFKNIHVSQQLT